MSFHDMPSPQKMARVFGYALTLGDSPAWHDFSRFAEIYLSEEERAKLAHAALKALGGNDLLHVIADAFSRAGPPREAWYNPLPEAREWADWATPAEREAYCLAAFEAMPSARRKAFLHHVQGRDAA
ncbi:MAG: hypothetical protein CML68_08640 [Rhodobacteraceae bacterium]|nr:hypothetical protein [Paracoccaceae bacterium]